MNEPTPKNLIIDDEATVVASRRKFLKNIACGSLLALGGSNIAHAAARHFPSYKTLALENIHTGDKLKLTYFEAGSYIKDALQEISYLFRDYHTGDVHPIDPSLLDQLYDLKRILGVRKPFHIISGYRSPLTNAKLRRKSHGVAKNSFHMQGRAIDIQIAGVETRRIRNAAIALQRGGVGYYPRSDFVHLDTGNFRTW
ncbi:MAG: YcbK family protein [Methylobacter sp.]